MSEEFTKRLEEINRLVFLRVAEEFTAEHHAAEGDTQALKQMNQALADLLMKWADRGWWIEAAIAMPVFGGADVLVASVNVPVQKARYGYSWTEAEKAWVIGGVPYRLNDFTHWRPLPPGPKEER